MSPALPLAIAGFGLLAMSLHRHAGQVGFGRWPDRRRLTMRALGFVLLALSCAVRVIGPDWRFALVEWIGLLTVAAAVSAATLTTRPRWLPAVAGAALVVAPLMLAL